MTLNLPAGMNICLYRYGAEVTRALITGKSERVILPRDGSLDNRHRPVRVDNIVRGSRPKPAAVFQTKAQIARRVFHKFQQTALFQGEFVPDRYTLRTVRHANDAESTNDADSRADGPDAKRISHAK